MTMLQVFANKKWMELAVALSGAPSHDARNQLQHAGIPTADQEDFLRIAMSFRALREHAHCAECNDTEGCLDDNTLAEFVDGVVPPHRLQEVEQRLAHCGACLHKALDLARLANELAPRPSIPAVVISLAQKGLALLSHPLKGFEPLELQPLAMMGEHSVADSAKCWSLLQGHLQGVFTMAVDKSGAASLHVRILQDGFPAGGNRIALRCEDLLLESQLLPESGEHFFFDLSPAEYIVEVEDESGNATGFPIELQEAG